MGKYAVTNAQWQAVMGAKPSEKSDVKFQGENQPVINVSWDNCKEFCKRLSKKLNKNVRLPSEAEWEYACRAGTTTAFHFGETITPELVNYNGNYPYGDAPEGEYRERTIDVQSFSPNAWGLYQMHGNVWEWCEDEWHENYNGAPTDGSAWLTGGEQDKRALRGGSWFNVAFDCRSAFRNWDFAVSSYGNIGFRVVVA
jgi:formylglycine-generating enzyme required for sulfatase activity